MLKSVLGSTEFCTVAGNCIDGLVNGVDSCVCHQGAASGNIHGRKQSRRDCASAYLSCIVIIICPSIVNLKLQAGCICIFLQLIKINSDCSAGSHKLSTLIAVSVFCCYCTAKCHLDIFSTHLIGDRAGNITIFIRLALSHCHILPDSCLDTGNSHSLAADGNRLRRTGTYLEGHLSGASCSG